MLLAREFRQRPRPHASGQRLSLLEMIRFGFFEQRRHLPSVYALRLNRRPRLAVVRGDRIIARHSESERPAMQLRLHAYDLPLAHTFTISRESISSQPTLIVELSQNGLSGFGEATSNKYYGFTIERMARDLAAIKPLLEGATLDDPAALWSQCQPALQDNPFALCALDQAAHDLWGKLRGQQVWKLWGLSTENIPASNYTLGIDKIDAMVAKMNEFPGWPIYKIKLGTDRDLEIVRELRKHTDATLPRRCQLRLDRRPGDRLCPGAQKARRRVHRAAAESRPVGRSPPGRAGISPADHRRRKLHCRKRRAALRRQCFRASTSSWSNAAA